ncbi:MAG: hypothetical protein U9R48_00255 [Chloroflexota bacterium]|nr:hypothetical protein [Chloroflexota bacterium]
MKTVQVFITVLVTPLAILNILGGIVAGIWLAVLGEWGIIGTGILSLFLFAIFSRFIGVPAVFSAALAGGCAEKGKTIGAAFFGALTNLYMLAMITAWCYGVMFFFVRDARASNPVPRLLWSYGLATAPWASIARQEARRGELEGFGAVTGAFFTQLAYATVMILLIFTPITFFSAVKVFVGFMAVALVFYTTLVALIVREAKVADPYAQPRTRMMGKRKGLHDKVIECPSEKQKAHSGSKPKSKGVKRKWGGGAKFLLVLNFVGGFLYLLLFFVIPGEKELGAFVVQLLLLISLGLIYNFKRVGFYLFGGIKGLVVSLNCAIIAAR